MRQEFEPRIPKTGHIFSQLQSDFKYLYDSGILPTSMIKRANEMPGNFLHGYYVPIKCFDFQKCISDNENPWPGIIFFGQI